MQASWLDFRKTCSKTVKQDQNVSCSVKDKEGKPGTLKPQKAFSTCSPCNFPLTEKVGKRLTLKCLFNVCVHPVVLVPVCVYYVLYTLVFVVADKLSASEPDLLSFGRRTQILTVPSLPKTEQPGKHKNIMLVLIFQVF